MVEGCGLGHGYKKCTMGPGPVVQKKGAAAAAPPVKYNFYSMFSCNFRPARWG